ncbi:MAG: 50S ribosomal protein L21 [Armatimonadota bacterium]
MYAVIKTGGKQYKVSEGEKIKVEKLNGNVGDSIELNEIISISTDKKSVEIGSPVVEGASVTVKILEQDKDKKVTSFRYKPKKRVRIKRGHRQPFTLIEITKINHK